MVLLRLGVHSGESDFADVGGGTHFTASGVGTFPSTLTTILAHSGALHHEGLRITSGKRYILVGFIGHINDCY